MENLGLRKNNMKALVLKEAMNLVYEEVADPVLQSAHDVLVKIRAIAICGSDVHGMDGSTKRRIPPLIMGHEASGEVVQIGSSVTKVNIGDRVTFDSTAYCGHCFFCLQGSVNLCDTRRVLGVSCVDYKQEGCCAELAVIPEHIIYKLPDELDFIDASLTEPAAVAAHALNITEVKLHDSFAIVGAGLIGLLLIQILRVNSSGLIIALEPDAARREAALKFGADLAIDPTQEGFLEEIYKRTNNRGVDIVFEAVGNSPTIETAIKAVRKGGKITLIGNYSPTVEIPLSLVITKQITLKGSCAISGEYPLVLDLMAKKKINVRAIVSAIAPLKDGASWLKRLYDKEKGLLKVVLEP